VAEEFRVPLRQVRVTRVDTDVTPLDTGQSGSSTTVKAGHAVRLACQETKRQLFERAASVLEAAAGDLETADGKVFVKGSPDQAIPITELFVNLAMGAPGYEYGPFLDNDADLVGGSMFYPPKERGPRGEPLPKVGFSYCSQAVDVEVDTETGRLKIHKLVSVLDPGKPINATLTRGQIEGGVGFGIGTGILEEMSFVNGRPTNPNLTDYRIPTALDVPNVDALVFDQVETDFAYGPYGAKGIGEVVVCATSAAIANAIRNATGVRIQAMPLTQERVALAIAASGAGDGTEAAAGGS
jgi:CO/xanthine dehydrogenase Mo-binding subunit